MSQQELVRNVVRALEAAGIPYMVTGAIASSLHGEPRTTHDVDLVVEMGPADVGKILGAFPPPQFYLDESAVRDAVERKGAFNLIEVNTGEKVDFWLLTDSPFDQSRFARRYAEGLMGTPAAVTTPEDTILVKLWWANLSGGSEKQFIDALRVYEIQFARLDLRYLRDWAEQLDIAGLLAKLEGQAEAL